MTSHTERLVQQLEIGEPLCGPGFVGLPDSDNPTVRGWSAMALASLRLDGTLEALRRAHASTRVWTPHATGHSTG